MRRSLRHRSDLRYRWRTALGAGLLLVAASATPVDATPRGVAPASIQVQSLDGSINTFTPCQGPDQVTRGPGGLSVRRGAVVVGDLSVNVAYGGMLAAGTDYDALPNPVVIPNGETSTIMLIEASKAGTITLTVQPGDGYVLGDQPAATATFTENRSSASCPAPADVQTVPVGSAPKPIDVYGMYGSALADGELVIAGEQPPGLTFNPDGSWTGKATTVGTYDFVARYCSGELCVLELTVRIIVTPLGQDSPPAVTVAVPVTPVAPGADPVEGRPIFTG